MLGGVLVIVCPDNHIPLGPRGIDFNHDRYTGRSSTLRFFEEAFGSAGLNAHEQLTDREYQVFMHIVGGKSIAEIAEILHLSVHSVSTYRSRILEKMQMKNNVELVKYAYQHDLID